VECLKFLQDGSLAGAVSGVNHQVYPPGVPVPVTLGDDRQEMDLTIGKRFGRRDYLDRLTSRTAAGHGVVSPPAVMTAPATRAPCRILTPWQATVPAVFAVTWLPDARDVVRSGSTGTVHVAADPGQLQQPADDKPREWRSEERAPSVPREAKVTDDD
jgi:hypothetical protein